MGKLEHESEERGLPLQHVLTDRGDRRVAAIAGGVGMLLLAALVAVAVVVGGDTAWWLFALLAAAVLGLLFVMYRNIRVWAGWGNPQLHLPSSADLRLGDRVVVRFRREARRGIDLSGLRVSAWIEAEEIDRSGLAGQVGQADALTVFSSEVEVLVSNLVDRTVEADLALEVPLSAAPPSFELGAFGVRWTLLVRIEAPNAPDDDSTFPLAIAPVVAERVQSGGSGR